MSTAIVRGSAYISMLYEKATPRLRAQRSIVRMVVDGSRVMHNCTQAGTFTVNNELELLSDDSDQTWLVFVSEPITFECTNINIAGVVTGGDMSSEDFALTTPGFELRALQQMRRGMVRIALANNCSTASHYTEACADVIEANGLAGRRGVGRDATAFTQLLRNHSDIYPTTAADISFIFPSELNDVNNMNEDVELRLVFDWAPASMADLNLAIPRKPVSGDLMSTQLLMFAIPHQQQRLQTTALSPNEVLGFGCTPTLLGFACPVLGSQWSMLEHLHRINFTVPRPIREEMRDDLAASLKQDLKFQIPQNYLNGAGDSYFSGKMLTRLARILIIADEQGMAYCDDDVSVVLPDYGDGRGDIRGEVDSPSDQDGGTERSYCPDFTRALRQLRTGVQVWLNRSSQVYGSPLLYDPHWGGLISCGCDYVNSADPITGSTVGRCDNTYPNCPALSDVGMDFGNAFYNDHHFQYGYHIYAAAVLMLYDPVWARKYVGTIQL
jgi:hypothetical protein